MCSFLSLTESNCQVNMKEKLYYNAIMGKSHFIHEHIPERIENDPYIFLNPIFDEKKRSQRFYAQTAREFCKMGIPVIRFDYYGTGDSEGQLFELNLYNIKIIVSNLIDVFFNKYKIKKMNLLGLRIGADIAMLLGEENSDKINNLILIEPIVIGKRYLSEQRSRRKIFYKINNMTGIQDEIIIDGEKYEDHQGYPISYENIQFLDNLDSTKTHLNQKDILLVKLNTISSRKTIGKLKLILEENNQVNYANYTYDDFWANLEPIDTMGLSKEIANELKLNPVSKVL